MSYLRYLKYLLLHKYYVAIECFKRGLILQGICHDISKFRISEYKPYALFFCGKGQQEQRGDRIKDGGDKRLKNNMEIAWLHHIHRNKHHWNYWIVHNRKDEMQLFDMPHKYIIEMICDWEGASKALRGKNAKAKDWYERQKDTLLLSENTRNIIDEFLHSTNHKLDT